MPPITVATGDAALKQIYRSGYMADTTFSDRPILALMPKFEGFTGRNMPIVNLYGHPAGRSQVFGVAQNNANPSQLDDFLITRVHDYGVTQIDGESADAAAGEGKGAWLNFMTMEIDGIINQTADNLHGMIYGNGWGFRGTVAGVVLTVLTLTNVEDASKFEVGMWIDGTTAAAVAAPHGFPNQLVGVDRIAGTITGAVNWNAAFVATDGLFCEGDYTAIGSTNMLSGLEAWVPVAAPGAGAFFGVNRTADVVRLGGARQAAFGGTVEESLVRASFLVDALGGRSSHCFLNPTNYRDLVQALSAKRQYETTTLSSNHMGMKAPISFKAVLIDGPKGPIKCVSDFRCPIDVAWMLQMDTWVLASIGGCPKIINQRDGNRWLRIGNQDGYEVRVGYYAQIGCRKPGWNCRIAL